MVNMIEKLLLEIADFVNIVLPDSEVTWSEFEYLKAKSCSSAPLGRPSSSIYLAARECVPWLCRQWFHT